MFNVVPHGFWLTLGSGSICWILRSSRGTNFRRKGKKSTVSGVFIPLA